MSENLSGVCPDAEGSIPASLRARKSGKDRMIRMLSWSKSSSSG